MSEKDLSTITGSEETREAQPEPILASPGRRRLGGLGLGGTAVALSVTSRSAVAGWGQCTGSELASGNLSRDPTKANPCGCSPGYWWNPNGTFLWNSNPLGVFTGFMPGAAFNQVFGCNFLAEANRTLATCGPSTKPPNTVGANGNTAMHAVAALLNAAYYGTRYPVPGMQTPAAVVAAFKDCFNAPAQTRAKRFVDFVKKVDVYDPKNTWCQGKDHGGI